MVSGKVNYSSSGGGDGGEKTRWRWKEQSVDTDLSPEEFSPLQTETARGNTDQTL